MFDSNQRVFSYRVGLGGRWMELKFKFKYKSRPDSFIPYEWKGKVLVFSSSGNPKG